MPRVRHFYAKAYDMAKATMCAYSQSYHALPHCKCVFWCCAKCPSINLPDQEINYQYPDTSTSIFFHIYHIISRCTKHNRLPLTEKKICRECQQDTVSGKSTKMYTRKELVMMETTISNFRKSFIFQEFRSWRFTFHT